MNVKVWNDGPTDHKEQFLGEELVIKRGDFITMPRSKAIKFLGQFTPFSRDGHISSQGIKRLRIEEDAEARAAKYDQPFTFAASDSTKFRTKEGLKKYEESLTVETGVIRNAKKRHA